MKDARSKRRPGRWLWTAAGILILAGFILYRLSAPRIQDKLEHRISHTITSYLGDGAEIGSVRLTWQSLVLNDIYVPVDRNGSLLRIGEVAATLKPTKLLGESFKIEQMVSSVRVSAPDLCFSTDERRQDARTEDKPWLPQFTLPPRLFSIINPFSELTDITVDRGGIRVHTASTDTMILCEYQCVIQRSSDGFHASVTGHLLEDSTLSLVATAKLSDSSRCLDICTEIALTGNSGSCGLSERFGLTAIGKLAADIKVTESAIRYTGGASLTDGKLSWQNETISCPRFQAELRNDTVIIDSTSFTVSSVSGVISGEFRLSSAGYLDFGGRLHIADLGCINHYRKDVPSLHGNLDAAFAVCGTVAEPFCEASIRSSDLQIADQELSGLRADIHVSLSAAEVCSLGFATTNGSFCGAGTIAFYPHFAWNGSGEWLFPTTPSVLGWKLGVKRLSIVGTESGNHPVINVTALDSSGQVLCVASVSRNSGQWIWESQSPKKGSSKIVLETDSDRLNLTAKDAHFLIGSLVPDLEFAAASLRRLNIQYSGGVEEGTISCDVQSQTDSMGLWSRIARELHFSGQYDYSHTLGYAVNGIWKGEAGNGDVFEGQANVVFADRVLNIEQLFIDAVGSLKGTVDLRDKQLDLELTIADLSLGKLPIPTAILQRFEAKGTLAGHVRAQGSFEDPKWFAGFAMTDGSVFGVPGYWMNVDASGTGLSAIIESYELGRGVRKIIRADGEIDGTTGRLKLSARVGAARAEDFVLALTGKRGIISGEMDGRGTIDGTIDNPEVDADIAIRDGQLFNEIYMDEFDAAFQIKRDSTGERLITIPRCKFSKRDVYGFSGTAALYPTSGGPLQAHLEGQGDFLDILDQMDRAFRTEGSDGTFSLDFGGTFNRPQFLGGGLRVSNGKFVYPDATPGVIHTELAIRINNDGKVDSGSVLFQSDNQWIELKSLQEWDASPDGLVPLEIHTPRICLGILEMRTGTGGMPLRLPGLMKSEWTGVFSVGTEGIPPVYISGYGKDRLRFDGGMVVRNARITFPFVSSGSGPMRKVARWIVDRLKEAQWGLDVTISTGNHYSVEITGLKDSDMFAPLRGSQVFETIAGYLDHLSIDAILDPAETPLQIRGIIDDNSFHLNGRVASTRGKVDYLDQSFQIEHVFSDFDGTDVMPILEGRARTTGQDSLGRDVPIYLTMYQIDRETGIRQERGRLNNITYVLEGDGGETPEQILRLMGYDVQDLSGKAGQLMASTVVRALGRRWLDPLERRLERWTMLDEITFSPGRGKSTSSARAQRVATPADTLQQNSMIRFFTGSQFTVGKYLTRDLFLTYTGELTEGQIELGNRLGFVHVWNLEYRINPMSRDLVLDFAVEYDELERKRDESVSLKYTFALEP